MPNAPRISTKLPPFLQGSADGLCGLYSVVNGVRVVCQATDDETQLLFNRLVYSLSRRGKLAGYMTEGIANKDMLMMLNQVRRKRIIDRVELPWRGVPNPDLTTFWKSMQRFLDGTPGRAIILGTTGYHEHWTVIEKITSRSILLYDSGQINRLLRSECSTTYVNAKRIHLLWPAQTYFLSKDVPEAPPV